MTHKEYLAADGVSQSMLADLHPTPAHYKAKRSAPRSPPTDAMLVGTLADMWLFKSDATQLAEEFEFLPEDFDGRTSKGKELKKAIESQGKTAISFDVATRAHKCVEALLAHEACASVFTDSIEHPQLFAPIEIDDAKILRKGELDCIKGNVIGDLKTLTSIDTDYLSKTIYERRYHVQAAYYLDLAVSCGYEVSHFFFLCVENQPPHQARVVHLSQQAIELGRKTYLQDLRTWKFCTETDTWPGFVGTSEIDLPPWAYRKA